jgi:fatty acid desaturase
VSCSSYKRLLLSSLSRSSEKFSVAVKSSCCPIPPSLLYNSYILLGILVLNMHAIFAGGFWAINNRSILSKVWSVWSLLVKSVFFCFFFCFFVFVFFCLFFFISIIEQRHLIFDQFEENYKYNDHEKVKNYCNSIILEYSPCIQILILEFCLHLHHGVKGVNFMSIVI